MTVAELIEQLQRLPQDQIVILQKDAEGDGYSPLEGVDGNQIYIPENSWSGNVYHPEWSSDDAGFDDEEWEEAKATATKCCVLFPIN